MNSEQTSGPFIVRHEHSISPHSPGGVHVSSHDIHDLEDESIPYGAYGAANDLIGKIADGHTVEIKVVDHGRTTIAGRARRQWFLKPTNSHRYDENGIRRVVPCRTVSVPRPPWTHEAEITPDPADEPVKFSSMMTWELDCLRSSAEGRRCGLPCSRLAQNIIVQAASRNNHIMPLLKSGLEPPDYPDPPPWIRDAVADADGHVPILEVGLDDALAVIAERVADDVPKSYACRARVADVSVWFSLMATASPDLSRYEQGIGVEAAEREALDTTVSGILGMLKNVTRSWIALPSHDMELEVSLSFPSMLLTPHVLIGDLLLESL